MTIFGRHRGQQRRLKLHPAVAVYVVSYFVLVFGALFVIAVWREQDDLLDNLFVQLAFPGVAIALPTYVVWRLSRSEKAGNITCVVMTTLMYSCVGFGIIAAINSKSRQAEQQAALERYERVIEGFQQEDLLNRMIAGQDISEEAFARLDEFAEAAEALAKSGDQEMRYLMVVADALRQIGSVLVPYRYATRTYEEAGTLNANTLQSREDIEQRIALLDACERECKVYYQEIEKIDAQVLAGLKGHGLTPTQVRRLHASWQDGWQTGQQVALRKKELLVYNEHRDVLVMLRDHWGAWQSDGDGYALFESPLMEDAYQDQLNQLADSEDEYELAYRELGYQLKKIHEQQQAQ
ncbi:MAG: hypothetical protein AAGC44_10730 [Planctomycetota bacterium]